MRVGFLKGAYIRLKVQSRKRFFTKKVNTISALKRLKPERFPFLQIALLVPLAGMSREKTFSGASGRCTWAQLATLLIRSAPDSTGRTPPNNYFLFSKFV